MKVDIDYSPMQTVEIPMLDNAEGIVIQIHIAVNGTFYEVSYFHNGEQRNANFLSRQLSKHDTYDGGSKVIKKRLPFPNGGEKKKRMRKYIGGEFIIEADERGLSISTNELGHGAGELVEWDEIKQILHPRYVRADVAMRYARMRERAMLNKMVEQSPSVIAEILRDENALYSPTQLRYVEGKIEVPVGHWAWMRIREIVSQQAAQRDGK